MLQNKRKLNHIESIRAIAALSVAIFHFTNYSDNGTYLINNKSVRNFFVYGAQGVEIFYLISGFIIPYALFHGKFSLRNFWQYLAKRFIRLLPPYFLTILAIVTTATFLFYFVWELPYTVNWLNCWANAFFFVDTLNYFGVSEISQSPVFWINPIFETLKVEVQFYLLIGLTFPLILRYKTALPIMSLLLLILGVLTSTHNTVLFNAPYFIMGISAFLIQKNGWGIYQSISIALSLISLVIFYLPQDYIAALFAFTLIMWLPTHLKFLNLTGRISYSYYLIHGFAGGQFIYLVRNTSFAIENPYLIVLFALLISWLAAFLMYFCIEKPSIKLSKRIKYSAKNKKND